MMNVLNRNKISCKQFSLFDDCLHAYKHARWNIIILISINLSLRLILLLLQHRQKNIIYLFQTPTKNPFFHMCTEEEVFSHLVLLVYKVYLCKHAIATSFYASNLKGFGSNGIQKEFTQCIEKQHLNKKFIKRGDNIKRYILAYYCINQIVKHLLYKVLELYKITILRY